MTMHSIGLRAQKGSAITIALSLQEDGPHLLRSSLVETAVDGVRLSFEPFQVASELPLQADGTASPEARAAVAEGRKLQDERAALGLQEILYALTEAGQRPAIAALLVNRASWVTDLLEHSLGWEEHVPVVENLAVRDALRFAAGHCELDLVELDEKSLPEHAAEILGLSADQIDERLKQLGEGIKPWRKEQKLAALAAWVAAKEHQGV